ncbi:protein Largen [Grus japonensis]|uniref:Protein Largen n=1 Tax=Grus japonensis TaxID=30415 RepID=A0ABC9Y6B8_GRUJA
MSAQSKGTASSSSSPSEGPPAASKAKVKEQIKIIVEDLELVLGDLKDVAKELKELMIQVAGRHVRFLPVNPETRKLQFVSTKRIRAATIMYQYL